MVLTLPKVNILDNIDTVGWIKHRSVQSILDRVEQEDLLERSMQKCKESEIIAEQLVTIERYSAKTWKILTEPE